MNTPEAQPHVIPEVKTAKSDIRMERTGTHKYNTRSITKRVNHVTIFKSTPNMFKMNAEGTIKTQIGTDYLARINPKKDTMTVKPIEKHINCKDTGKILGYIDLVKMDALVWTNSM